MFGIGELTGLEARRAELLAASQAQRQELCANCARLQPVVRRMETGFRVARRLRPILLAASPLLGLWAARKGRRGLWNKLRIAWQTWQTASTLWKQFSKKDRG